MIRWQFRIGIWASKLSGGCLVRRWCLFFRSITDISSLQSVTPLSNSGQHCLLSGEVQACSHSRLATSCSRWVGVAPQQLTARHVLSACVFVCSAGLWLLRPISLSLPLSLSLRKWSVLLSWHFFVISCSSLISNSRKSFFTVDNLRSFFMEKTSQ